MSLPKPFALTFTGDVMLGRLIDQLRSSHVDNAAEARHIRDFTLSTPTLQKYSATSPWGNTLPLFHSSDLNIINLETSVTTYSTPWPNKVFNYRMHPSNVDFLLEAKVHYAGLANNHSLDFCQEGLVETVRTLENKGIKFAGAGRSRDEALQPADFILKDDAGSYHVHVYSASDHPRDWAEVPGFHYVDYKSTTRDRLRTLLNFESRHSPALKIFSIHWGPNYRWSPSQELQDLAHFLIDECNVDMIHGHSSHHVQGVEVYKGKPVIYGCGDFVDDYAVDSRFRNDISAVWRLVAMPSKTGDLKKLIPQSLEVYPTSCSRFVTNRIELADPDYEWVKEKFVMLSSQFGTEVREEIDGANKPRLVIEMSR